MFASFAFSDSSHGWAVSMDEPGVFATSDGGRSWHLSDGRILGIPTRGVGSLPSSLGRLPLPGQVLSVGGMVFVPYFATAPGWVASPPPSYLRSGILVSSDGGATWRQCLALAPGEDSVLHLVASDATHLWALCGSGNPNQPDSTYLLRSTDGGNSWTRLSVHSVGFPGVDGGCPFLVFTDSLHGWKMFEPYSNGVGLALRTTADGGQTWRLSNREWGGAGLGFFALDARHAWFADGGDPGEDSGALYATSDDGRTWQRDRVFDHIPLGGVFFADPKHGWVITENLKTNAIYRTQDGGLHWSKELTSTDPRWSTQDWSFSRAGDTLFAGNGMLLLSTSIPAA